MPDQHFFASPYFLALSCLVGDCKVTWTSCTWHPMELLQFFLNYASIGSWQVVIWTSFPRILFLLFKCFLFFLLAISENAEKHLYKEHSTCCIWRRALSCTMLAVHWTDCNLPAGEHSGNSIGSEEYAKATGGARGRHRWRWGCDGREWWAGEGFLELEPGSQRGALKLAGGCRTLYRYVPLWLHGWQGFRQARGRTGGRIYQAIASWRTDPWLLVAARPAVLPGLCELRRWAQRRVVEWSR